ncbi:MAG: hypothetical protein H6722_33320 [Sandaracinus sp.]|nr:hypothetical protein [Sandaracinus sp.]MCB9617339.1 hypothetical protein [Sandaracinus sp.]
MGDAVLDEGFETLAKKLGLTDADFGLVRKAAGSAKDAAEVLVLLAPDRSDLWRELAAVERARGNPVMAEAYEEVAQCLAP